MDRNLFRRKTLVSILWFFCTLTSYAKPIVPLQHVHDLKLAYERHYKQALRTHATPKAWSIGIFQAIEEEEIIKDWIQHWSTNEGLLLILQSRERVSDYISEVSSILRNARIPWELIAIPIVESNWQVNAVSSSGAAGPWQFMESSGRGRDLEIDLWRDDRRNIWKSTKAVTKEIMFSYNLFKDWLLTIASYNAGPTRLRQILKNNDEKDFWSIQEAGLLPIETQNYVPQVIAVTYINAHAGRYGFPVKWDTPIKWHSIQLKRSIHLDTLAEITQVDREILVAANPDLLHPVTPPSDEKYVLHVPVTPENAERLKDETILDDIGWEQFWIYTIKKGDTINDISKIFEISIQEISKYNPLIDSKTLRIGERLYIPSNSSSPPAIVTDKLPDWQKKYIVKPGDSLWAIAKSFHITPEMLAEANYRTVFGVLKAGSVLKVPETKDEK